MKPEIRDTILRGGFKPNFLIKSSVGDKSESDWVGMFDES